MGIRDRWERENLLAGALVLAVLVGVGSYFYGDGLPGGTPTGDAVREALELSTGSDLEVLRVEDEGSLDRVVMSDGSNVIEAYVTEDRKYLVQATSQGQVLQGFTPLHNLTRSLRASNRFVSCLDRNNATFYGVVSSDQRFSPHTQMVQLQIQVLGGAPALQVFGGVGPQQLQPLVLDFNQTRGIVWQVNGSLRGGLHTVQMLEQRTPCTFDAGSAG